MPHVSDQATILSLHFKLNEDTVFVEGQLKVSYLHNYSDIFPSLVSAGGIYFANHPIM